MTLSLPWDIVLGCLPRALGMQVELLVLTVAVGEHTRLDTRLALGTTDLLTTASAASNNIATVNSQSSNLPTLNSQLSDLPTVNSGQKFVGDTANFATL